LSSACPGPPDNPLLDLPSGVENLNVPLLFCRASPAQARLDVSMTRRVSSAPRPGTSPRELPVPDSLLQSVAIRCIDPIVDAALVAKQAGVPKIKHGFSSSLAECLAG